MDPGQFAQLIEAIEGVRFTLKFIHPFVAFIAVMIAIRTCVGK